MFSAAYSWIFGSEEGTVEEATDVSVAASDEPLLIRWGFVGLGDSAWDMAECVAAAPECQLVAVTSASLAAGERFGARFGAEQWSALEVEVAAIEGRLDVVYVSGPVDQRRHKCLMALDHGWHVVAESPLALNEREAEEIVRFAAHQSLLLLEAVPGRFCPASFKLDQVLLQGTIGTVSMVRVDCSGPKSSGPSPPLWEGALLPLGAWALAFASRVFEGAEASVVAAAGDLTPDLHTDLQVAISLSFGPGQVASICCSTAVDLPGEAHIYGSSGSITVAHPVWQPHKFTVRRKGARGKPQPEEEVHVLPLPSLHSSAHESPDARQGIRLGPSDVRQGEGQEDASPAVSISPSGLPPVALDDRSPDEEAGPTQSASQRSGSGRRSSSPITSGGELEPPPPGQLSSLENRTVRRTLWGAMDGHPMVRERLEEAGRQETLSRVSEDGSLRGWVREFADAAPKGVEVPTPEGTDTETDTEGEVDLGWAASQTAADLSDSDEAASARSVSVPERFRGVKRTVSEESAASLGTSQGVWPGELRSGGWRGTGRLRQRGGDESGAGEDSRSVYLYIVEEVVRCLREGSTESPRMPWSESLQILRALDSIRTHIGLIYSTEQTHVRIPSLSDWGNLGAEATS